MKLFRVDYSGSVLFAAENETEARKQAQRWINEEVWFGGGVEDWEYPEEVAEPQDLPTRWDEDTLVWGNFDGAGYTVKDVWEGKAKGRG